MAEQRLVYFADPMCSWCYGFSPVIGAIAERFEDRMPLHLVMGGLRAGNASPMRPEDKDYIRSAWTRVNGATNQPFDFGFFERDGFVYDTEPACRAVVTARRLMPNLALGFMGRIQQAFYAENRDMTCDEEIATSPRRRGSHARSSPTPSSPPTPATRPSATSSPPSSSASAAFPR